jgi:hypothetical protein
VPALTETGPAGNITRQGLLRRLGAGAVGITAASILADRRAAVAEAAPQCCYGLPACGCGCPGACGCGWYCTQEPPNCRTWRCCDHDCNGNGVDDCICVTLICRCC